MESVGEFQSGYNQLKGDYLKRAQDFHEEILATGKLIAKTAWIRLIVFLCIIGVPFFLYTISVLASFVAFVLFLVLFVRLVKRFNRLRRLKEELLEIKQLNDWEVGAINGNWSNFGSGEKYIDPEHDFSYDLDLLGKDSFFQYINRTTTISGEEMLKERLCNTSLEADNIKPTQQLLKELSFFYDFRQWFYAKGRLIKESQEDLKKINALKNYQNIFLNNQHLFNILLIVSPILFLGSLIYSFFGGPGSYPTMFFFINLAVIGGYLKRVNKVHQQYSSLSDILRRYAILVDLFLKQKFDGEELIKLQQKLAINGKPASSIIEKFGSYLANLDQRNNMIAGVLLNGVMLWDIFYVLKIEKWLLKNVKPLNDWLWVIHQVDALNSMANFVYNHPDFSFPVISDKVIFDANEIGHPLISRSDRVCNNYSLGESVFTLITGANMSGKSTFLRTVGLNLVLAKSGMVVCARYMQFKPIKLITNMRTTDSLTKHESYFFAELKRLQYIIGELREGAEVFVILDEILKGTNSKDKTYGSMEFVKHMLKLNVYGLIATHDLELGKLENDENGRIQNMCFEVENSDERLIFDYKLQRGVTQKHNATFLMKQMGIIQN